MNITLKSLHIENFKGCRERTIDFGNYTNIRGANGSGKTTLEDAFVFLLFNTDSTGAAKFQIRPKDKDGNLVHSVEIKVEATLDVDGEEVTLSKTQKEKWVKKRGTNVTELQGNENLYEINGYPKSEKDYTAYIKSLLDEDLFKLLTNPLAFPALPWKKQREILMQLADSSDDAQLASEIDKDKYESLIPELKVASTDDIRAKYTKALNTWKAKQKEIPARIDEVSKLLVDVDVNELETERASLQTKISDDELKLKELDSAYDDYENTLEEKSNLEAEINTYCTKASKKLIDQKMEFVTHIAELNSKLEDIRKSMNTQKSLRDQLSKDLDTKDDSRQRYLNQINELKEATYPEYEPLPDFDESTLVCPTCGRDFPDDIKAEKLKNDKENREKHKRAYELSRQEFNDQIKDKIANAEKQASAIEDDELEVVLSLKKTQSKIEEMQKQINGLHKEIDDATTCMNDIPSEPDLSEDETLQEMEAHLLELDEISLGTVSDERTNVRNNITVRKNELADVEKEIASADNTEVEEHIEQLKNEQREVGQNVADQERMIYLLESFIRDKMDRISEQINSKFQYINFQLFETQLNGGISETCKITKDGVAYADINSAGKIQAGLDVIKTLQKVYNVTAPIFIDNRESVTEIPEMDSQLINLYVDSDYPELQITTS